MSTFTTPGLEYEAFHSAPDGNGGLWSIAYQNNTSFPYAVKHAGFDPLTTSYPLISSTQLSAVAHWFPGFLRNYNEGGRFTIYDWCLIVDPWNDLDGDGVLNRNEIMEGTNPSDPASVSGSLGVANVAVGQTGTFSVTAPGQSGNGYLSVLSLQPFLYTLADWRAIGPSVSDPLANYWLTAGAPQVTGAFGTLNSGGQAMITVMVPPVPALAGLGLLFGLVTLDAQWSLALRSLLGPRSLIVGP